MGSHQQSQQLRQPNNAAALATQTLALKWMMFLSVFLTLLLMSHFALADENKATENLYAKHYKAQSSPDFKSLQAKPDTKMYVSNHKDEDNISMLENGYDLMGTSGFDAQDVPADLALQHGKAIGADTVLVYSKYGSAKSKQSKIAFIKEAVKKGGEIDAKDLEDEPTEYEYYASYWAKIPAPLFGVHIIKLKLVSKDEETDAPISVAEKGLKILAVIKDSPAAKAGIVRGDVLLAINEVVLDQPEELSANVRKNKGKEINVRYSHDNEEKTTRVQLN